MSLTLSTNLTLDIDMTSNFVHISIKSFTLNVQSIICQFQMNKMYCNLLNPKYVFENCTVQ